MTTKNKKNKYYVEVTLKDTVQSVMISQIRIIDTKRLDEKVGYIKRKDLLNIKSQIKDLFN